MSFKIFFTLSRPLFFFRPQPASSTSLIATTSGCESPRARRWISNARRRSGLPCSSMPASRWSTARSVSAAATSEGLDEEIDGVDDDDDEFFSYTASALSSDLAAAALSPLAASTAARAESASATRGWFGPSSASHFESSRSNAAGSSAAMIFAAAEKGAWVEVVDAVLARS